MQLNPLACFVYVALLAAAFAVLPASAFQIIWTETDPHFVNSWVAGKTSFAISDDNPTLPETILMPDENEICTRIKRAQKHREIAVYHSGLRLARIAMQEPYGSSYAYVQTNVLYQNDPDIFFCCNECDTPIQTGNFPSETALNLYGYVRPDAIIIACKAGALLQKPVCKCTDLGPSVQSWCPIGSYLGGCTLANPTYTCKPCTNIDTTTAEFISNAGTSNNCLFRCKSGLFYDRSIKTEKCVPCSTCGDGFRVTKACSRDVNFETFASNDVKCSACEIAHKQSPTNSSKCVPCGFGFAANQITNGCFKCGDMQFTSTMTAAECTNCPHGMKPNSARSACNNCGRGHYRNYLTMNACAPCPAGSFQPDLAASACSMCVEAYAPNTGMSACLQCESGKVAVPLSEVIDPITKEYTQIGSTACVTCDPRAAPSNISTFQYSTRCEWQCKKNFFQDRHAIACVSCADPCPEKGQIRPFCSGADTRLPLCVTCQNKPFPEAVLGTNFEYTGSMLQRETDTVLSAINCPRACLPGFQTSNNCRACSTQLPLNAVFVDSACAWACKRGWRKNDAQNNCVPCDVLEHPRTLDPAEIAKAVTAGYFGSTTKYADFGACADALLKVFGVVKLFPLPAGVALCGNGVLETRSEQCDDGNTVSGDGCSSLCTKEGRYFDCWVVGEPCKPNCSFPYIGTAQDLGLYGYYLTDPFCSKGPQALESRAPCGAECSQSRLGYGECSPQNRGCLQCTSAQYPDAATQECAACGSLCQNGFYASTCAALPSNYHADTNNQLTPAQRGCYPCRTISGSETGSVWVSPGTLWNVRKSCKRVCATGYYCPRYNTTDGTCSTDIDCVLCSTIKCQTGFHASPCTATRDTECVPCENKPENSIWVDSDTDCDFKCESHTRYIAELVLCDPCENPKTCTHEKFAPYPCSESASATVNTAQAKYCRRCPEPSTPGMEAVASQNGDCSADCIAGQYFSTDLATLPCAPCSSGLTCAANTMHVPCTRRSDTRCELCPQADALESRNEEFYIKMGEFAACHVRCRDGFTQITSNGGPFCVLCSSVCSSTPGFVTSHSCSTHAERFNAPTCEPCSNSKPANSHWTLACQWDCDSGFYLAQVAQESPVCSPCEPCAPGAYPLQQTCTASERQFTCALCSGLPANAIWASDSDPSCPFLCKSGYTKRYVKGVAECKGGWVVLAAQKELEGGADAVVSQPSTPAPIEVVVITGLPRRVSSSAFARVGYMCKTIMSAALVILAIFIGMCYYY